MKDPAGFKLMTYRSVNVLTDCTMLLGTDFEKEIPVVYQNMLHFIDYFIESMSQYGGISYQFNF